MKYKFTSRQHIYHRAGKLTHLLNPLNFRCFLYYVKWLETGRSCQDPSRQPCSRETREEGGGGVEIPSVDATITCLSLSPGVRTLGNVHCGCTINYYLPGSAFDKPISSLSLSVHAARSFETPLPIILIKVVPFLNKKVYTCKGGTLWGF